MKLTSTEPIPFQAKLPLSTHLILWVFAALIGAVTSIAVWAFLQGFALINSATLGTFGALPPPVGWLATALIPALGGLVVGVLMHYLSRPDTLAAMAHIIDGVAERGGKLNYFNGVVFVLGSMLGIGVGAPVGADTPAAMIGGHLSSWVGQRLKLNDVFIRALVVAGVGAGISATYFAQLAAVFFAFEVVLGGFGGAIFVVPVLVAIGTSALVTGLLSGAPPQYNTPMGSGNWSELQIAYIGVALVAALASIAYVNLLPRLKKVWTGINLPYWAKPALAGLMVGIVGIWFPDIFGTGLSQMKSIFAGNVYPLQLLIIVALAKIVLTPNSLGAGFVGGVIGPALLIGSWLGAAYGDVIVYLFPGLGVSPVAFAMVATAAMLAATFHAPLFGAMMVFEMVNDYRFLLPLLLAAGIGYGVARLFQPGSAYTFAFASMGIKLSRGVFSQEQDPTTSND